MTYSIKYASSGRKVVVYKDEKPVQTFVAGKDFLPADAGQFAKAKYAELMEIEAKQMTKTEGAPTVATPAEEHAVALKEVQKNPKGVSGKGIVEASAEYESKVASLEATIKQLRVENTQIKHQASVETKARRGLAIAKQEIENGKLANSEDAVTDRVKEIAIMSSQDIDILERITAGLDAFDVVADANKYAASKRIEARIHKQGAEEAMEDGDSEDAITQESKAKKAEQTAEWAEKIAQEMMEREAGTAKDVIDQVDDIATGESPDESYGITASDLADLYTRTAQANREIARRAKADGQDEVAEEAEDEAVEAEKKARLLLAQEEMENITASDLADLYQRTADANREIAKRASEDGEDEVAEEAEDEAVEAEKKAQMLLASDDGDEDDMPGEVETEDDDEDDEDEDEIEEEASCKKKSNKDVAMNPTASELIELYSKVASLNTEIARQAQEDEAEDVVEEAKEEAQSASKKAEILRRAQEGEEVEEEDEPKTASIAEELADTYRKIAEIQSKIADQAEASNHSDVADAADKEAEDASAKAKMIEAAGEEEVEDEDEVEMTESKKAQTEEDEEDEVEMTESKKSHATQMATVQAGSQGVEKLASVEHNTFANDPNVEDLTSQLWS